MGDHTLAERRGLLLRVIGPNGSEGWGDAAPLPGFSSESPADAARWGRRLLPGLRGMALEEGKLGDLLCALPIGDAPPSIQFAVEGAVVELLANMRSEAVVQVLGGEDETVALNALITDAASDLGAEANRLRERGFRAVKLKVGRRSVRGDAKRVRTLAKALGTEVALRLDANRAWTLDEAVIFARALDDVPFAYVEEPLLDPTRLPDLVNQTGLPIAIDETTREGQPETLSDDLPLRAVVLKPTLLGGIAASRRWARWARRRNADPVVSASYESGVGLRMLGALAASLSDAPAGLSTYAALETDVLQPRLLLDGAVVEAEQNFNSKVNMSILDPVDAVN